jgi:hypothetical protein
MATITVTIDDATEKAARERLATAGMSVVEYLQAVLERFANGEPPPLIPNAETIAALHPDGTILE